MKYVDLTRTFIKDMPVYPGDPLPTLKQIATIEKQGFVDHELKTAMHVGTHMDAPMHMIEGGKKLSEINPEKFFGRGVLLDAREKTIDAKLLANVEVSQGDIVLILTGFSHKFKTNQYYENYPQVSEDLSAELVKRSIKAVGMDTPSPDGPPFKIHKILLAKEILIIENLTNLEELVGKQFEVAALPAKFDTDSAPVRVIARLL